MSKQLVSNRAKEIVRMRAELDADARGHDYGAPGLIDTMLRRMRTELEQEYAEALQRWVRLKEML